MSGTSTAKATELALLGGSRLRTTPFAPWPHFTDGEIEAAAGVLRSGKVNYWTGTEGREFEKEFAQYTGTRYAVTLANGSVAIELALRVLGIGPGDEVITTPRTFLASASSAVMVGATPVFADIDPESGNITSETIERVITKRTRAVIPVHLAGWPCDLDPILNLCAQHNIHVIEDCAQANGARYKGRSVGSFGVINAWSFCQDKIMTTAGEGGMITTDREDLWSAAWTFKDHGKSYDAVYHREHKPGFRWLHESFGTNWRATEIQSVVGRRMLARLDAMVATRRRNASLLIDRLRKLSALQVPVPAASSQHSYYKFYCYVRPDALKVGWDRDRIMAAINAEGIPCFSGSCSEVYLEKAFPAAMRPPAPLPQAHALGDRSLMFLVHPTLSEQDMDDTACAVEKVLAVATK
jgi:dTDP-4-amino-4,6-dideoxygalactose transaminase